MVSVDIPLNLGADARLKSDIPEFGDRVPSRQFRKSRTFLNFSSSKRESKKSKEHKEAESSGLEASFGNKGSQKNGVSNQSQRPEVPKKETPAVVTLDKVLGNGYQAIDIHAIQDISNDIFPSRPISRRGRSKQRNFDIMEADEEEENHESVRDLKEKLEHGSRLPTEESNLLNKTNYGGFGDPTKFRATIVNLHRQDRNDTSREKVDPNRTSYQPKYPQNAPQRKKTATNSQSPRIIKEYPHFPQSKQYIKTEENLGISPLKTFGNKFNRMPAASTIYSQAKNENTYLMTGMNFEEFGAKSRKKYDKKSQDALNTDMYKTQNHMGATHEDLSAERVFMGFRNMEENRRFAKENRFLNQKSAIDEKFKDEDKILLEKYGARFGITPDECNFKPGQSNAFNNQRQQGMNLTKRISTPFAEPKRYDTFYRSKRFQNGYNQTPLLIGG